MPVGRAQRRLDRRAVPLVVGMAQHTGTGLRRPVPRAVRRAVVDDDDFVPAGLTLQRLDQPADGVRLVVGRNDDGGQAAEIGHQWNPKSYRNSAPHLSAQDVGRRCPGTANSSFSIRGFPQLPDVPGVRPRGDDREKLWRNLLKDCLLRLTRPRPSPTIFVENCGQKWSSVACLEGTRPHALMKRAG